MTVVKLPFVASTSSYQPGVIWRNSDIPVSALLCRATLGTWLQDKSLPDYLAQCHADSRPFSPYHFLMNAYGSADQAKFYVNYVLSHGGFGPGDVPCLDVEDASAETSLISVIDWFYNVETLTGISHKDMLIYSRASYLNPLKFDKLTASQKQYLLEIPGWMAGYPDNPDPYDFAALKKMYQADPARYGPCVMVQYAASVEIPGINPIEGRSTECNTVDETYLSNWQKKTGGVTPPPPTGEPMQVTANYKVNIRADHSATSADVGDFLVGQTAEVSELWGTAGQEQWAHIPQGWVAVWYPGLGNNGELCTLSGELPPPPAPSHTIDVVVDGVTVYHKDL